MLLNVEKKEFKLEISYREYAHRGMLSDADQLLFDRALDVTEFSYAPYSQFLVGAAMMLDNEAMVIGHNVENASFPATICAERVALGHALARYPGAAVDVIAIRMSTLEDGVNKSLSPCGICRQVLLEQEQRQGKPIRVLLQADNGMVREFASFADLLPFGFTGESLPKK